VNGPKCFTRLAIHVRCKDTFALGRESSGVVRIWCEGEARTKLRENICRPPDLEFFTGARRHGSNTPVFQETLENVLTATIVLTSTLVVLEMTSVT